MATISNVTLEILKISDTSPSVNVRVRYNLNTSLVERQAHSVFSEAIALRADDGASGNSPEDTTLASFPAQTYTAPAVGASSASVARSRTMTVAKSLLNEDPQLGPRAEEVTDEVLARVTVTYAANAPTFPPSPPPAFSAPLSGAWK